MINKIYFIILLIIFYFSNSIAQEKDSIQIDSITTDTLKTEKTTTQNLKIDSLSAKKKVIDPLAPSRAAFYSAVLPGLGQAYNKKYWKIPIVYAALGTGIYSYAWNQKQYNRYRDAFKRRLAGYTDDEFYNINNDELVIGSPDVSDNALIDAQEFYQQNRDLSLLITVVLYALNIIDANVDAHLQQYNVSEDLSLRPFLYQNEINFKPNLGLALSFQF